MPRRTRIFARRCESLFLALFLDPYPCTTDMPFIPHTETDVKEMLAAIKAPSIEALFDEIPPALRCGALEKIPEGLSEMAVTQLMQQRAQADSFALNFIGAGAYEHHIPEIGRAHV